MEITCRACDTTLDRSEIKWSWRKKAYEDLCSRCLIFVKWGMREEVPRELVDEYKVWDSEESDRESFTGDKRYQDKS